MTHFWTARWSVVAVTDPADPTVSKFLTHYEWRSKIGIRADAKQRKRAPVMLGSLIYHRIVERTARRAFEAVNRNDYDALIDLCRPDVTHRFGGRHALGGVRHDTVALRAWFERLGRVMPTLDLTVNDLWVKGGPWNTTVVVRWTATGEPLDGGPYANHGVHVITMRWGKVVSIDANEDSQAVADVLQRQARSGLTEALAAPIES